MKKKKKKQKKQKKKKTKNKKKNKKKQQLKGLGELILFYMLLEKLHILILKKK